MKTYELTQQGFNGATDATDHLIKWVSASSIESARDFSKTLIPPVVEVRHIEWLDNATEADGIDYVLP